VYHNDRDDNISSKKREEIESEVRSYVTPVSAFHSADGTFRILKAGEKRATDLLKEKEVELHLVRNVRLLIPVCYWRRSVACSKLARALVEYETLDLEEVKKVIKGEPIRSIAEVLDGEVERKVEEETSASSSLATSVGQAQAAT
jgi:ATP-dependent metalloprotease